MPEHIEVSQPFEIVDKTNGKKYYVRLTKSHDGSVALQSCDRSGNTDTSMDGYYLLGIYAEGIIRFRGVNNWPNLNTQDMIKDLTME